MRFVSALILTGVFGTASADTTYLGLYLQGQKVGYSSYAVAPAMLNGQNTSRSDSRTVMNIGLLGQAMAMNIDSTTWSTRAGAPLRMKYRMASAGRVQTVDATFSTTKIVAVVDNGGRRTQKTIPISGNQRLVDDPLGGVIAGQIRPGTTRTFYVLDPTTVDLIKNDVRVVGPKTVLVAGRSTTATLVEIIDPRATMSVYLSSKGDIVRVDGPMGIEMRPISRRVALADGGGYAPSVDLAVVTRLRTDKPLEDTASLSGLKLRITGRDLSKLPNGEHQTVLKDGAGWIIDVHPVNLASVRSKSIEDAGKSKPGWLAESLYLPAKSEAMRQLAKRIIGDRRDAKDAALAIRKYVFEQMTPNAGIGVLRDAGEVWRTKEGVCRDYAVLTTTLLRAAGIPARLASGLVSWQGAFYYHAWAEAWTGEAWIGLDSTTPAEQISAGHVKLGEGSVETAFTFAVLTGVKLELLETRKG